MAGTIKGITIEIGGDTTKLDKALTEVNSKSRSLQSELKQVEKLLKLDPGNTELLAQKQKLLKDAIGETSQKLNVLKEAQSQVQTQFEKGEVSEEQYRALQREIVKTEADLKNLKTTATESNMTLAKVGEGFGKLGDKTTAAGKAMLPVTAAVAGVGAASMAAFNEVDEGYDTIITKTGATGKELEALQENMDNVFTTLPTDAETAGTAVGEVKKRFGETGKELEDLSSQFIQFAEINKTDVTTSIDGVDAIMTKFNVDTSQTGNVLGLMTKAGQTTGISMDTLQSTLETNGATLKEMGLNLTGSVNLLAQFEAGGVDASTAMAGLKKAQQNATKEGKTLEQALGGTITSIKDAGSETEALQIATELFGKKGAAEMTQAIREGRFSVEDLNGSLLNYGNVVEDTFTATLDAPDQAKMALNSLKLAGADLANVGMTTLQPMIAKVVDKVKEFTEWFKNLNEEQKQTIIKIALVAAAMGPALIVIGKITSGIGGAITMFSKFSGGIGLAGKALTAMTGPVGIVIAIIAALVAGFVYLYNTSDTFRATVQETFAGLKKSFSDLMTAIKPTLQELQKAFMELMTVLQPVFEYIITKIAALLAGIMAAAGPIIAAITNVIQFVTNIIKAFVALLSGDFEGFGTYLKAALKNVGDFLVNIITAIVNFVTAYLKTMGIDIGQIFTDIWTGIKNIFANVGQWFKERFQEAYTGTTRVFSAIGQWFAGRWNDIQMVFSLVGSFFTSKFQEAYAGITAVFNGLGSFFSGIWENLKGIFTGVGTSMGDAIGGAFKNVINSVLGTVERTINNAISFINSAINTINDLPGVNVGKIKSVDLPRLAKGGTLQVGQAIMAEAGPELITMTSGGAIVTPLTNSARNTAMEGIGAAGVAKTAESKGFTQNNHYYSPKALSPSECARQTRNATRNMVLQLQGGA